MPGSARTRTTEPTDLSVDPQKADVETVQAKRPSVLLTLPVDPVVTASAYQAAARQGTKIVLLSSVPQGMTYGRDYVNLVTDDLFQMGKRAADALAAAIGGKGKIAYFFHDANHYVTNQRDQAFLSTIRRNASRRSPRPVVPHCSPFRIHEEVPRS